MKVGDRVLVGRGLLGNIRGRIVSLSGGWVEVSPDDWDDDLTIGALPESVQPEPEGTQ